MLVLLLELHRSLLLLHLLVSDAGTKPLPDRPLLKPWYRLAAVPGGLVLEYGQVAVVFEGAGSRTLLPPLLALLDGTRTAAEVIAAVGPAVEPATRAALDRLAAHDLLTDGPALDRHRPATPLAELLAAAGVAPANALAERIETTRIAIVGEGPAASALQALLALSGVGGVDRTSWKRPVPEGDLVVVAPAAQELPRLEQWNVLALRERVTWLQSLPPNGRFATVGPLVIPGETSCRRCFLLRRAANVEFGSELEQLEREPATYPVPAPLVAVLAGLTAFVALRWVLGGDRILAGAFYGLELGAALALTYHRVHRVPRCPECSPTVTVAPPSPWFGAAASAG